MSKLRVFWLLVVLLLVGLTACSQKEEELVQQPEEEEIVHVYPDPMYDPALIANEVEALISGEPLVDEVTTEAEEVAVEPIEEPELAEPAPTVDYCIECHTDKEALIATANPEEEVVSENEGEG